jgi:hypothetical protein
MMRRSQPALVRFFMVAVVLGLAGMACNLPFNGMPGPSGTAVPPTVPAAPTDEVYTEPPPLFPTATLAAQPEATLPPIPPTTPAGPRVEFQGVSFDELSSVFSGVQPQIVPLQEGEPDTYGWPGPVPETYRFDFQGYLLPQPWIQPQILVYPIPDYAWVNAPAGDIAAKLDSELRAVEVKLTSQPFLPMWNAGQVFSARPEIKLFQNGKGIRYLTCYAQAFVRIDAACLFYTFQGLSTDGKYYVSAILPVDLAALHSAEADGLWNAVQADTSQYDKYIQEMTRILASATPSDFTPDLDNLDELVQSLNVSPMAVLKSPVKPVFSCPGAPATRLAPGSRARVTFTDGTPLRVRETPGKSGKVLKTIPEGTEMFLLEGPTCADQGVWWRMQTNNGSITGWVMEGEKKVYFLEPWQ